MLNSKNYTALGLMSGTSADCNDIAVLTTRTTEGISNSVLEYMALSKPVVVSGGGALNCG